MRVDRVIHGKPGDYSQSHGGECAELKNPDVGPGYRVVLRPQEAITGFLLLGGAVSDSPKTSPSALDLNRELRMHSC